MKKIKCALFDLDGTLINTITDLGNACNYVIKKHGFKADWSEKDYLSFVGNGNKVLVNRAFKNTLNEEDNEKYLKEFLSFYNEHYLDNTDAYEGIKLQLEILKKKGVKLCVITNKTESAAIYIVEYIFGKGTFDLIIGQRDGLPTKPDPEGVNLALNKLKINKDEAIYFGDSEVDMQTAINSGVKVVAVTWGFRTLDKLLSYNPYRIIDKPEDISKLF